jgi:hypothetical protein
MKWRRGLKRLANDIVTFVDDIRGSAYDANEAWLVGRQLASRLQYLGIQDAARKRRPPSTRPGAWAGAIPATVPETATGSFHHVVTTTVSQEKWDKAGGYVRRILKSLSACPEPDDLEYKDLERVRGFLVHLAMTFPMLKPYLKGLHLTLAAHLPQRDSEGWKRGDKNWMVYVAAELDEGRMTELEAHLALNPMSYEDTPVPVLVRPVMRMGEDFRVLEKMFQPKTPPLMMVRCNAVLYVLYGFGDASGSGFGSSLRLPDGIVYIETHI